MDTWLSEALITQLTAFALRVVAALALFCAAWIVAGWAGGMTSRSLVRIKFDTTLTKFFGNVTRWVVLILSTLACLSVLGIQPTSFAAVLAAAGFAIGLAFQNSLSNFSAGVMLLVLRPFNVGDVVEVAGKTGKVDEIALFTTQLDTFDNRRIIIPNSAVFSDKIENITYHAIRRVDVAVGTDYSADLDATRSVLDQAAREQPGRLPDREGEVVLLNLGGSSIDWEVRVWAKTAEFLDVKQSLIRSVKNGLDQAGIGIPFPQMDVHFDREPDGDN
jgi:small conductance mechanosensitive channel